MCYFCHAQLFEITHAEKIKSPLVQHSCRNAKVAEAFCHAGCRLSTRCWAPMHAGMHVVSDCGRPYRRERRGHAIVASQYLTSRDFVPWRFSAAGRLSAWLDRHAGGRKPCMGPWKSSREFTACYFFLQPNFFVRLESPFLRPDPQHPNAVARRGCQGWPSLKYLLMIRRCQATP
jgi:hypothetical protein